MDEPVHCKASEARNQMWLQGMETDASLSSSDVLHENEVLHLWQNLGSGGKEKTCD